MFHVSCQLFLGSSKNIFNGLFYWIKFRNGDISLFGVKFDDNVVKSMLDKSICKKWHNFWTAHSANEVILREEFITDFIAFQ